MAEGSGRHMAAAPRRKRHGKVAAAILVVIVVLFAGVYGYGRWYFSDHFLPHTTANGHDVSLQTTEALAQELGNDAQSYELNVQAGDFNTTLTAADLDLKVDADSAALDALAQQQGLVTRWPLELAANHSYDVDTGIAVNDEALASSLSARVADYNQTATLPQDATVGYSEGEGAYVVNPEVAGTTLVPDAVVDEAREAADTLSPTATCGEEALVQPTVLSSDTTLTQAADKANQMLALQIPLTVNGETKLTVGRDQIAGWITFDEAHNAGVDSSAVASYVKKTVAPACAKSDDSNTYSVDRKALTASLSKAVDGLDGSALEVPLVATKKAEEKDATSQTSTSTWNGSGRYIDVDISQQHACLFDEQGNVLWESSVVTGNTSEGRSTPSGTYAINAKTNNMTLVGADENHDGQPDYVSHVDYWMPFIGASYGFHDASWRSKFGGSIYRNSGSHGCVNLPHEKAQQLFGLVNVGDKVVIHQ